MIRASFLGFPLQARSGHLYTGCRDASPWLEGGDEGLAKLIPEHLQQPGREFQCKVWQDIQEWVNMASSQTLETLNPRESESEAGLMLRSLWLGNSNCKLKGGAHMVAAINPSDEESVMGAW